MAFTPRTRLVNPRLGLYYGIFTSLLTALFMVLLILELLGVSGPLLRLAMLMAPLVLYAGVGIGAHASDPMEMLACGRRVPAVFTGLGIAGSAFGATGLVTLTGVLYLVGFDALCLVAGGVGGLVVMAVSLAPFLRKFGTVTIPGYLGRRLQSRLIRLVAAALLSVPLLLVIVAEIRVGAEAASLLVRQPVALTTLLMLVAITATTITGGMRSITWSNVAAGIAALIALLVPVAIVAIFLTNLPLPQLSHGPILRGVGRSEQAIGMALPLAPLLAFELPGEGFSAVLKPFAQPFGVVGSLAYVFVTLGIMAGVAGAPWLLPRLGTAPGVYEARKSLGWATFFFGLAMITIAAAAVFMRDGVLDIVIQVRDGQLPQWLRDAVALGFAQVDAPAPGSAIALGGIRLQRDAVLYIVPILGGMPDVILAMALAGIVAAALAAATSSTFALAAIVAEDVLAGLAWEPPPPPLRVMLLRGAIVGVAVLAAATAAVVPADPLRLLIWALVLSASASFPVLVLSVWWKRLNAFGGLASICAGFVAGIVGILAGEAGLLGLSSALAPALGLPIAIAAAIVGSLLTPAPDRNVLELTRDLRVPGGETIYDRDMRLMRLKQRTRL